MISSYEHQWESVESPLTHDIAKAKEGSQIKRLGKQFDCTLRTRNIELYSYVLKTFEK